MTTLELVPGRITTREELVATYGGSIYSGGIVPAKASGKVFLFSDPAAGEKHGYTFDGRAEDDEFGVLYLYTGAGSDGDQELARGNKVLLDTVQDQREVHLFVADGKVAGTKRVLQRYVGRVVLDPAQPYEERRSPTGEGTSRLIYVFRLRPAEGVTLALTEQDTLKPAAKTTVIELRQAPVAAAHPQVKDKPTEQHVTAQTVAHVIGGPRPVNRREGQLVKAFEEHLADAGHAFKSFQITVKGEVGALIPDVYDATDNVLYEAKGLTTRANVRMAIGQLADYRRHLKKHIEAPDDLRLAVLLPTQPSPDARDLLAAENIALVVQTPAGFEGFPLSGVGGSG